jgi:excisionase family DNA binding protein
MTDRTGQQIPVELTVSLPAELVEEIAQRAADILEERLVRQAAPRWLTIDQAAEYIAASKQRVYDLRSSGRISRHGDGRRALVDRDELDQLIEAPLKGVRL